MRRIKCNVQYFATGKLNPLKETLKEELRKRRLPKSGNKDALINRLTEWLRNSRQNPSPSVSPDPTQPVCVDLDAVL